VLHALISATSIRFSYPSGEVVLQDLEMSVSAGTALALNGPSGSGKSTLLFCLAGLLVPQSGVVEAFGHPLPAAADARADLRLRRCGFVFQRGELLPELTVLENVALPLRLAGMGTSEAEKRAITALEELEMGTYRDRAPESLSGGQAQRVAVARALIRRPDVVFADEPTASVDQRNRDHILKALLAVPQRGGAVIIATHDRHLTSLCTEAMTLPSRYETN
jgi:putative ABC transport system ATP-binding protein